MLIEQNCESRRMKNKTDKAPSLIMNALLVTSLFGSVINSTILGISTAEGKWIIGEVCCQLYALLSFTLVSGALWLTALAAFERWYKLVAHTDYLSTFSEINTRIIIKGVLMMAFGLCTGPLYGWGEYSYFKGLIQLKGYIILPENNETTSKNNTSNIPYLCQRLQNTADQTLIDGLVDSVTYYMENSMWFRVRSTKHNCVLGEIELVLRALQSDALSSLQQEYLIGGLGKNLAKTISLSLGNMTNAKQEVNVQVFVNESEITVYRNIYLSFQELGICTLDISPVNTHVLSSTAYIIFTTVVIPFGIIVYCGLYVLIRFHIGSNSNCYVDIRYLKITYVCGFLSILLCIPYYIINILNSNGSVFSTVTNFVCTFLFYNSSLCVTIPYILHKLPRLNFRKHALALRNFTGGVNEIRRNTNDITVMSEYV